MLRDTTKELIMMLQRVNLKTVLYTAGAAAVTLAGVLYAVVMFVGVPVDGGVKEILLSPYVIDRDIGADSSGNANQPSPLLHQAAVFAQHLGLNEEASETLAGRAVEDVAPAMPRITPKFRVFVTSSFETDPGISLALIDEPGRGKHWIRQSDTVGHFSIAHVRHGFVVVKKGEEIFEVPIENRSRTRRLN